MNLKTLVEDSDTRAGWMFDLVIQSLIVLSLAGFALETLPDLSPTIRSRLRWVELAIVGVFTAEYLLRLAVADRRLRFVFSVSGLIDLIAILPYYLPSAGLDLRSVRVFRLFRAFHAFKIIRYSKAVERYRAALYDIREELVLYLIAASFMVYLSSVGIYYFEHEKQPDHFASVFHCLWWSVVTLTTVGYGDCYPVTVGGKVFTGLLVIIGLGVVAVPSGLLAAALTKTERPAADD